MNTQEAIYRPTLIIITENTMNASVSKKQIKDIEISKNIALHHVYSQAGSIEKALSEAVMNSVDAKATEIRIDIADDGQNYTIADNGCGFASEEEITECFGTLGFDHQTEKQLEKSRTYGAFGLGRAQLWAWSRNTWKSGPFRMHVDLEANGLTYELETDAEPVSGCTLEGQFYTPITIVELNDVRRHLKELTQYMEIDIIFNGGLISTPLSKMKFDRTTEDAYFRFSEYGGLTLYNQGMLVTTYPSSKYGVSGLIISRKNLTLNVARNEVMSNKCTVMPGIVAVIKEEAKKIGQKNAAKLTDADRIILLRQILGNPREADDLMSKNVIRAVNGRYYSVKQLIKKFGGRYAVGDYRFSQVGETIINQEVALVLDPHMFSSLGYSPDDFNEALQDAITWTFATFADLAGPTLKAMDYAALAKEKVSAVTVLDEKKLTKSQKAALATLKKLNTIARKMSLRAPTERRVYLGRQDIATAWTDGQHSIGYNADRLVSTLSYGYEGFTKAVLVMVHEYAHSDPSVSDHAHDVEFYKRYHDASMWLGTYNSDINRALVFYGKERVKLGLSLPKKVAASITRAEGETMVKELEKRAALEE